MCVTCGCNGNPLAKHSKHARRRIIEIERAVLADNASYAAENRMRFDVSGVTAFNVLSSPGSGKTTLLVNTITALASRVPVGVIEGDQHTDRDAQRVRATGVPAVQINTGKGCHLDARMVRDGVGELPNMHGGILFIENVGNLVCPAEFDLGEHAKVVVLSVTEGDDKPLKYPAMFSAADVVLINKIDLLPYVDFAIDACRNAVARLNPRADVLLLSATRGDGMADWLAWIERAQQQVRDASRPVRFIRREPG